MFCRIESRKYVQQLPSTDCKEKVFIKFSTYQDFFWIEGTIFLCHAFQFCLPYHRFKDAFDPIDKGTFIAEKFPSSVETWPGTSINISQTEAGNMVVSKTAMIVNHATR